MVIRILILFIVAISIGASSRAQSNITVNINNVRNSKGVCYILLFSNPSAFPGEAKKAVGTKVIKAGTGVRKIQFEKVPPGTYAISVIHDENEDGQLNTNFWGIPKEGYGASNNHLPLTSAPKFSGSSFVVSSEDKALDIGLKYF